MDEACSKMTSIATAKISKGLFCRVAVALVLLILLLGTLAGWMIPTKVPSVVGRLSYGRELLARYPTQNFTMPVDHFHNISRYEPHTNATFQQHYWLDISNYVPGGPVIIHAMGEDNPNYDLEWLQKGILHDIANATGGVAVLWGQRYYPGGYDIVPDHRWTRDNLRFHSTEQALADLAYFAQRATFPGLEDRDLTAPGTPWIILGGSYGGVISAFTRIQYPGLFWGGLSSSGVTTGILDHWRFFDIIRRHAPPECVQAQQQVTNLMDNVYESGNETALSRLKAAFNVSQSSTYPDLAFLLTSPFSAWNQAWHREPFPFTGPGSYCDLLTSETSQYPTTETLRTTARALLTYANKTATPDPTTLYYPLLNLFSHARHSFTFCAGRAVHECLSLARPAPFGWLGCTEGGGFATGYTSGTAGHPHALPLVSHTLSPAYFLDRCRRTYNTTEDEPRLDRLNRYGGVNLSYPRLALSTGELDFYRGLGPLAEFLENGDPNPRLLVGGSDKQSHDDNNDNSDDGSSSSLSGDAAPEIVIEGGFHEWDFPGLFPNETDIAMPQAVKRAKAREVEAVMAWLREWNATRGM
ncbi:uncharacterized protein PV07_07341 [Cladophialophora immunda]|uniref:Uncharacterized protein n=1 Tax=Cladophialophora immunda TaxID=569365 RepID=A0A0D1ZI29_9EURO|nr:uncharacterized protein PV07_07341 [Cladophialophora immunda]KIW27616.1 hypothetical protein PV07_07341 [Cladophialophora immunda]